MGDLPFVLRGLWGFPVIFYLFYLVPREGARQVYTAVTA